MSVISSHPDKKKKKKKKVPVSSEHKQRDRIGGIDCPGFWWPIPQRWWLASLQVQCIPLFLACCSQKVAMQRMRWNEKKETTGLASNWRSQANRARYGISVLHLVAVFAPLLCRFFDSFWTRLETITEPMFFITRLADLFSVSSPGTGCGRLHVHGGLPS